VHFVQKDERQKDQEAFPTPNRKELVATARTASQRKASPIRLEIWKRERETLVLWGFCSSQKAAAQKEEVYGLNVRLGIGYSRPSETIGFPWADGSSREKKNHKRISKKRGEARGKKKRDLMRGRNR